MMTLRMFWEPVSFLATMGIMPLLFLQFFNAYAYVCFTGHKYCNTEVSNDKYEKDRHGILIGFYVCAAVIALSNKMVKTPRQVKDRCTYKFRFSHEYRYTYRAM